MKITKKTAIGITLIVLIGFASWGLASALTEQQYIDLGKAEFHRGNYDAAIYLFTEGLEVNPDNQWLYNDRGLCYVEKGDKDEAIDEFSKAIEVEPDFAGAYYNRGLAYFEARGYDNAIADYTKAIELLDDPDKLIDAYYNRGLAYNKLYHYYSKPFTPELNESYEKALADFDKVLELDPEYALAHAAKGGALYRRGEFENAIAEFDIAVNARDWILGKSGGIGLTGVYKSTGRNYRAAVDYDKSIENYNMAMNYNPIPDGHQVSNYKDVGEWNKAIEIADRIIELRKDDPTFRTSSYGEYYYTAAKGNCYCHLGEYDKAMEMYDKAYEKCLLNTPDSLYKVYEARGDCYYEFEQYDKAMEMYIKAVAEYIKNRPNRVYDIYSKVGDVHLALGESDKAMEMYNKAVDECTTNRPLYLYRYYPKVGDVYLALVEYDKAMENYNKSISKSIEMAYGEDKYVAGAYKGLGIVYKELGENEKARAALETAKSLYEKYGKGQKENIEEIQQLLGGL